MERLELKCQDAQKELITLHDILKESYSTILMSDILAKMSAKIQGI